MARRKSKVKLPEWAQSLWEDLGSPKLDDIQSVVHGDLLERRHGLRRDDLVELLKLDVTDDNPAIEVVEQWISYTGAPTTGDTRKVQAIVQEFTETALKDSMNPLTPKEWQTPAICP